MTLFHKTLAAIGIIALPGLAAAQDAQQWQGAYAGIDLNWTETDYSFNTNFDNETNAALGIHGGYNYAVADNFVVGGELSYDVTPAVAGGIFQPFAIDNKVELRLRGGYAFNQYLVYAGVGAAVAEFAVISGPQTDDIDGVSYAIGVERKITAGMSARAEYSRSDFDISGDIVGSDQDAAVDELSLGLAIHF